MIFAGVYSLAPEKRNAVQERLQKTGGPPPKGIKMIGRWRSVGDGRGVTVFEANDAQAAAHWAQQWTDLVILMPVPQSTTPVSPNSSNEAR